MPYVGPSMIRWSNIIFEDIHGGKWWLIDCEHAQKFYSVFPRLRTYAVNPGNVCNASSDLALVAALLTKVDNTLKLYVDQVFIKDAQLQRVASFSKGYRVAHEPAVFDGFVVRKSVFVFQRNPVHLNIPAMAAMNRALIQFLLESYKVCVTPSIVTPIQKSMSPSRNNCSAHMVDLTTWRVDEKRRSVQNRQQNKLAISTDNRDSYGGGIFRYVVG